MDCIKRLKELKAERHLTNAQIAEVSKIPLQTVTRVISGATQNPTFDTIARITIALGGSLDVIAGIATPEEQPLGARVEDTIASYAELLKEKDERIQEKKDDIAALTAEKKVMRKERNVISCFLGAIVVLIVAFLLVDLLNGHFGYFRY